MVKDQSMVESLSDLSEKTGRTGPSLRCINCGYFEDPVVLANRLRLSAEKQPAPARLVRGIPRAGPLNSDTVQPA